MTVSELLERVMPGIETRTSVMPFMQSVQNVIELIVLRLWKLESDLLKEDWTEDVESGEPVVSLPDKFLGFIPRSFPWLEGLIIPLFPLPPGFKQRFTEAGTPKYFELRGPKITLYPTPDDDYTIRGEINCRPEQVTSLDDDIPFGGLFDQAITQGVIMVSQNGSKITATEEFKVFMAELVDEVARRPTKRITWHQVV